MVIGKRGIKSSRSAVVEKCLPSVARQLEGAMLSGKDDKQAPLLLEYGSLEDGLNHTEKKDDDDDKSKNVFLQESVPLHIGLETFSQKTEFRQSNDSRSFATLPDDDEQQRTEYIRLGSVLHNVFANIRTVDDVERALQRMELDGILYDRNITRERLESMIRKRFEDERVAEWYSSRWTLFNECAILDVDPETDVAYERRPDRVMTDGKETVVVDFKFGRPRDDYHNQVRIYMQLLSKMGHEHVRGYLWYVFSNEIVEVNI
jgi:CRISPR/Cas system-associated exonuclease Cas4 (RecB family)